jgi:hypothetical protein
MIKKLPSLKDKIAASSKPEIKVEIEGKIKKTAKKK